MSALFSRDGDESGGLPESLLDAAIDRAVDGTDRRLRALRNYRKRLREPAACAVRHVLDLVRRLPGEAAEISPGRYGSDARLRAAFASPEHLRGVMGRFRTVRDYLDGVSGPAPDDIYGLLSMSRRERSVLGMELDGDTLRRDVLQTAVSFSDHRYIAPSASERATRRALKLRAFDFLLEKALERMVAEKTRRGELIRARQRLRRKLEVLESGRWARGPMVSEGAEPGLRPKTLEEKISDIDAELGRFGGMELGLDESLAHVIDTLGRPDESLALDPLTLTLDYRGIKTDGADCDGSVGIDLSEVSSPSGFRRIVLLGRIPRDQLPEPRDVVKLGQAYLG